MLVTFEKRNTVPYKYTLVKVSSREKTSVLFFDLLLKKILSTSDKAAAVAANKLAVDPCIVFVCLLAFLQITLS